MLFSLFSTDVNTKDNVKDQGICNVSHFTISRNDKSQQCADKVIKRKILFAKYENKAK